MTRTLLFLALASGLGAQQIPAGEPSRVCLLAPSEAMTRPPEFGAQAMMEANRQRPLARNANHGTDRPGWWKRHLGDTALHVGWASADMLSSRGMYELNPVLGRGPFGTRQVAISASIVGGIELTKWVLARRYPRSRVVRAMSLVPAALRGGVAARNWRVR